MTGTPFALNYTGGLDSATLTHLGTPAPLIFLTGFFGFILMAILWSFIWKGFALWRAARNGHQGWFVALLILNTMGILEILYIFVFSKPKNAVSGDAKPPATV